jgi:HlyD family secretion protein
LCLIKKLNTTLKTKMMMMKNTMLKNWKKTTIATAVVAVLAGGITLATIVRAADETKTSAKPALTVTTTKPTSAAIAATFGASGNIAAWQEAIIGAESQGLRVRDVRVNVGDMVKQGQVLASFATETVSAELAQSKANVAEAEAALAEAQLNADRAKTLDASGALSQQQINQYFTLAKTAEARLAAARAMANVSQVRLSQTQVLAPDSGTISARAATVGSVVQSGQELFRMVRKNRLEWRAEVTAGELNNISIGQKVNLVTPAGESVAGTVRMIAPTVDPMTRNVQVYVDLVPSRAAKAGMFARGDFQLAQGAGLTVPQQALVIRDGFAFVFLVKPDNRVTQTKVEAGRRFSDRVEIRKGLTADSLIVAQGAGFLNDGDLVKISTSVPTTPAKSTAAPAAKK